MIGMRDRVAAVMVGLGVLIATSWFVGAPWIGDLDVRAVSGVVLVLGLVPSAAAVVPGFDSLVRGSRMYLAASSLLGLAAFGAAIVALSASDERGLVALVVLMVVLWSLATLRHAGTLDRLAAPLRS